MSTGGSENTWTVVKFIGDNTVNVVPTCWVAEDKCYWPPLPASKITQAIKSGLLNTHWPSHKVTIFRNATYDSYEVARAKSKKAEETSDLNTTEDEMSNNIIKRRRIINKNCSSSDEESSDDNKVYVKPPPTFKKSLDKCSSGPSGINKELVPSTYGNFEAEDDFQDTSRNQSSNEAHILRSQNVISPASTPRSAGPSNLDFASGSSTSNNACGCCSDVKRFLKEILRQQHLIRTRFQDLEQQIDRNNVSRERDDDYGESVFSGFNLPINTVQQFTEFNDFFNTEENFSKCLTELSKTGGNNTYEFVKRILSMIITNELSNQYSWLGRREKLEFAKLPFTKIIILAAEKANKSVDKKQTENSIAIWLRRAKDRMNNKKK